mmetsp:Transcript_31185/g.100060  ORF Transcript_31185/g.100060 Transcript_31185/m.100060 type:complete len:448 (+) Transcript_31185:2148-3491(+)
MPVNVGELRVDGPVLEGVEKLFVLLVKEVEGSLVELLLRMRHLRHAQHLDDLLHQRRVHQCGEDDDAGYVKEDAISVPLVDHSMLQLQVHRDSESEDESDGTSQSSPSDDEHVLHKLLPRARAALQPVPIVSEVGRADHDHEGADGEEAEIECDQVAPVRPGEGVFSCDEASLNDDRTSKHEDGGVCAEDNDGPHGMKHVRSLLGVDACVPVPCHHDADRNHRQNSRNSSSALCDVEAKVRRAHGDDGVLNRVFGVVQPEDAPKEHGEPQGRSPQHQLEPCGDVIADGAGLDKDHEAELVHDDGSPVVEERFSLDEHAQVGENSELLEKSDDSDGVRGAQDTSEEHGLSPSPLVGEHVAPDYRDQERLDKHARTCKDDGTPEVIGEDVEVCSHGTLVNQGGEEDEEDEMRVDIRPQRQRYGCELLRLSVVVLEVLPCQRPPATSQHQ